MLKTILLALLLMVMGIPAAGAADLGPNIRVGLVVNQFSAALESQGAIKVAGNNGKNLTLKPGKHFVSMKQGVLYVDNQKIGGSGASFLTADAKKPLLVNHKNYRGAITAVLNSDKKTLNIVNVLPLESYLYGVVAKEIIPLWPDEAIKAQTVAARSFALYQINNAAYPNFDIKANEMGQVYGGIGAEHANTNKIIDATRGMVAVYDGQPIQAFFHSTSGGYTESSANVWGKAVPYLQAVKDYDQDSPNFSWEKTFTRDELQRILAQAGYKTGPLEGIRLSARKEAPMHTSDRGISGRVKQVTFKGKTASVTLDGTKVRSLLGLDSTLFDIYVGINRPDYIEVPILNQYGMEIGKKKIPIKTSDKGKNLYTGSVGDLRLLSDVKEEKIFISGNGWGHGLGMSQWGARGMALAAAAKGEKNYYKKILEHYYTGIQVKKLY